MHTAFIHSLKHKPISSKTMATTSLQNDKLQMANAIWTIIEPQDADVKEILRQRLNLPTEQYAPHSKLSASEIVDYLSGILKDIPQEAIACDERAEYILSK